MDMFKKYLTQIRDIRKQLLAKSFDSKTLELKWDDLNSIFEALELMRINMHDDRIWSHYGTMVYDAYVDEGIFDGDLYGSWNHYDEESEQEATQLKLSFLIMLTKTQEGNQSTNEAVYGLRRRKRQEEWRQNTHCSF
jgi:hypothetical protein